MPEYRAVQCHPDETWAYGPKSLHRQTSVVAQSPVIAPLEEGVGRSELLRQRKSYPDEYDNFGARHHLPSSTNARDFGNAE